MNIWRCQRQMPVRSAGVSGAGSVSVRLTPLGVRREPLYGAQLEPPTRNAIDHAAHRFDDGGHTAGISVQQQEAIGHDADVTLPESKVTALELVEPVGQIDLLADFGLVHVAVAR